LRYTDAMTDYPTLALLRLLRAASHLESRISPELGSVHGLALSELVFLLQLMQAPLCRLRRVDLALRLNISQSTITRMAIPLEKTGLVSREKDPRDSRIGYVVLTKSGRTLVNNAAKTFKRKASEAFVERLSLKDTQNLVELLGRFTGPLLGDAADQEFTK
jgi:DNA-binding MarR family transcriptional regulator